MPQKHDIITFKVDAVLAQKIRDLPNRSEFIRSAVLAALDNTCPLCQGTGTITPEQKTHWDDFLKEHDVVRCADCEALYITCRHN